MKVSDLISAYAAAVGTAALGWQVRQARRGRRTAVSVRLLTVVFGGDPEYRWRIQATVSNRGERSTQVTQVNIRQGREVPLSAKGEGLPGVIPAGEQRSANVMSNDPGAEKFDPFLPIRAEIRLSSGQWIVSKRAYLGDLVGVPIDILDSLRGQPNYDTIKRAIVERIRVDGLLALYDERADRD